MSAEQLTKQLPLCALMGLTHLSAGTGRACIHYVFTQLIVSESHALAQGVSPEGQHASALPSLTPCRMLFVSCTRPQLQSATCVSRVPAGLSDRASSEVCTVPVAHLLLHPGTSTWGKRKLPLIQSPPPPSCLRHPQTPFICASGG